MGMILEKKVNIFLEFFKFFGCAGSSLSCAGFSSCSEGGHSLVMMMRTLLTAWVSLGAKHGLSGAGSVVVLKGISYPAPCGLLLGQRVNLSPALAGGLFTTEPPGKPTDGFYYSFRSEYPAIQELETTSDFPRVSGCIQSSCLEFCDLF